MEYRKNLYVELNKVQLKYEGGSKSVECPGLSLPAGIRGATVMASERGRRHGNAPFESEV